MGATLKHNAYGKTNVRLVKVKRDGERHNLFDITVDIALEGDLQGAFLEGDNSAVLPTDTIKNMVYVLGKQRDFETTEDFGLALGEHFLGFSHLSKATVALRERPWTRIPVDGAPHTHAFTGASGELHTALVSQTRGETTISSGITSLPILKTTGSAFEGFMRDEFTTLKDAADRPFGTNLTALWTFGKNTQPDYGAVHSAIRAALLETFAQHDESQSVQQTLYLMGTEALEAADEVQKIYLSMPNEHRLLVDLSRFGMENENEIFVPVDEPSGMIEAVVKRA